MLNGNYINRELMEKYCVRRLELYEKLKQKMMEMLQSQISLYREKIRFLEEIVLEEKENKNFWKLEETEMESYLREKQFVIFIDDPHYYFLVFYFYFYFINVIDYFEPYV
jgi:hypothetical protein